MRLYVCYGTFGPSEYHACARASKALEAAGHRPQVTKTYGCYGTDRFFKGRQEVKRLTGNFKVPTLVLDDGTVIDDSKNIAAWAGRQSEAAPPGTSEGRCEESRQPENGRPREERPDEG